MIYKTSMRLYFQQPAISSGFREMYILKRFMNRNQPLTGSKRHRQVIVQLPPKLRVHGVHGLGALQLDVRDAGLDLDPRGAARREAVDQARSVTTDDAREGIAALLEKRADPAGPRLLLVHHDRDLVSRTLLGLCSHDHHGIES